MRYYSAKTDDNQPEIVAEFRRCGAYVLPIHRLKNCCDLIVVYKGLIKFVEIKQPGKKLTEGEEAFRADVLVHGDHWTLITSAEEARGLVESMDTYAGYFDKIGRPPGAVEGFVWDHWKRHGRSPLLEEIAIGLGYAGKSGAAAARERCLELGTLETTDTDRGTYPVGALERIKGIFG